MNAITTLEQGAMSVSTTPADLLRMAVQNNADLDKLERLMDMQERWEQREARKAYDVAFTAFKSKAVVIIKNRTVTDGPLKNKKYAELFAVVNAVTPALSECGLSMSWRISRDEKDWIEVTCMLKHVAGHVESVSMGGPPDAGGAKGPIQARASTVTYLERYTAKAITGLSEQEDDNDGDGAEDPALQGFRDAAMEGEKALQAHFEKAKPTTDFWKKHSQQLKAAAKQADQAV